MDAQEAIALLRANPPHRQSPLPWQDCNSEVLAADASRVCDATFFDAAHIAAAVNAAPVLAAEVERLQDVVACVGVEQILGGWKIVIGHSIGVGSTPMDAVEACIDAEVHRQLEAARVAVAELPMDGHQIDCSALLDPDDDDPGGWCDCHMMTTIEELRRAVGLEG